MTRIRRYPTDTPAIPRKVENCREQQHRIIENCRERQHGIVESCREQQHGIVESCREQQQKSGRSVHKG